MGRKQRHTIVLDWDGTLVEAKWPQMGDWMPGAIAALLTMHEAGLHLLVFSARLSPYDPFTFQKREKAEVQTQYLGVRNKLDEAGLTFVDIWQLEGKPGGTVYVDDRGERYHGRPGSWRALTDKILSRCGMDLPECPEFDQTVVLDQPGDISSLIIYDGEETD